METRAPRLPPTLTPGESRDLVTLFVDECAAMETHERLQKRAALAHLASVLGSQRMAHANRAVVLAYRLRSMREALPPSRGPWLDVLESRDPVETTTRLQRHEAELAERYANGLDTLDPVTAELVETRLLAEQLSTVHALRLVAELSFG